MAKTEKKNTEISAFKHYQDGGINFSALLKALEHLVSAPTGKATTDELTELLKKICLTAQGSRFAISLSVSEIAQFGQFLMLACEEERTPDSLLKALRSSPADFREANGVLVNGFVTIAEKVVPKLVTHIQKTRNPASKIDAYIDAPLNSDEWVVATEAIGRRVSATDATLVGQRWFWEASTRIDGVHLQWIDVIKRYPDCDWFWKTKEGRNLPLPLSRFPTFVGSLSHQILFEEPGGGYISLSPLTSIGGLSQLASSSGADLIWRRVKTAEYGGANARNIAALMMDRSGQIRHPINAPWIAPKKSMVELQNLRSKPGQLVKRLRLPEKVTMTLFEKHIEQATNAARASRLRGLLEPLLEESCHSLLEVRQHALDNNLSDTISNGNVLSGWIYSSTALSDSAYNQLATLILVKTVGQQQTKDFLRWNELVELTLHWLKSV